MPGGGEEALCLASFLSAPLDTLRAVVPRLVLVTQGGTRRRAVLDGLEPHSSEYVKSGFMPFVHSASLWFKLRKGVTSESSSSPAAGASVAGSLLLGPTAG
jgi:hypothetical protein